jgi:hypothetical protein
VERWEIKKQKSETGKSRQNSGDGKGSASADEQTRERVASMGGKPHASREQHTSGTAMKQEKQVEEVAKV